MRFKPEDIAAVAAKGLLPADAVQPKPSKYRNRKTTVHGISFDSKREAERYIVLLDDLRRGRRISDLRLQVPIRCEVNGVLVCEYVADFVYQRDGAEVVEDAKGYRTEAYRLKKKLVKACTGIEIQEV